jgi:hypothetical protein
MLKYLIKTTKTPDDDTIQAMVLMMIQLMMIIMTL